MCFVKRWQSVDCRGGSPVLPGGLGVEELAVLPCWALGCAASSTPFLWSCPKKRGGAPKKNAWGGGAPVRFRDPPASPTRVGGATRPLRCPLRGRIESLAATARGLGWWKSSPVKVFCPAFLQKSGRGPGAEPLDARRSARNSPVLMKRRRGQRGNPRRGFPLCGRPRRPQPLRHRNAGGERTPGGDGTPPLRVDWRNVVGSAVDEGKGRRGRRPLRRVGNGPCAA